MGNPTAFLNIPRKEAGYRPVHDRVNDYGEVEQTLNTLKTAACKHHAAWNAECHSATGVVRLATDSRSGRTACIKTISKEHMNC